MNLAERIRAKYPNLILEMFEQAKDPVLVVKKEAIKDLSLSLRNDPEFGFNMLMDLSAVDYLHWEEKALRFEVLYNLFSLKENKRIFLKVRVSEADPEVDSVVSVWPAANWYEREVWDMFGIRFKGHPDLKRILMYEGFEGHALRKDYPFNKRQPLVGPLVVLLLFCLVSSAHAGSGQRGHAVQEADTAYYQGNIEKSINLYEKATQENPKDPAAHLSLGVTYAEKGEWDKSIEVLKKAQVLDPANSEVQVDLSLAYAEKEDFDRAVTYAQKAVKLAPKRSSGYHALGLAYEGLGEEEKALAAYRQGLQVDPNNADLYLTTGNLYGKRRDYTNAIKAYEEAIRKNPKNVYAYSNVAYIYQDKGESDKAVSYLKKATEIAPDDAVSWYDLGGVYAKRNDNDKAIECYEKSFKLDPKSYKTVLSLAIAYEKKRDLEKAAGFYVKAMDLTDNPRLKEAILRQITRASE